MAIGKSGGRSRGNKTSAEFRATVRERNLVDPPGLRPEPEPKQPVLRLTPRGESLAVLAGLGIWIAIWVVFALLLFRWWGLA